MFKEKPKMITATTRREYKGNVGYQGLSVGASKSENFMPADGVLFDIPKGTCKPYLDQYGRYVQICCDKEKASCRVEMLLDNPERPISSRRVLREST